MYFNLTYMLPDPDELGFFPLDEDSSLDFDFLATYTQKKCLYTSLLLGTPFV
jgi:hypothetical protein